jgi:hypothetical protein
MPAPSQAPSRTQASHWAQVTAVVAIANGRANVISRCGSFSRRSGSSAGEPIVTLPDGSAVIAGPLRHSLNGWPGFSALRARPSVWACADGHALSATAATTIDNQCRACMCYCPCFKMET